VFDGRPYLAESGVELELVGVQLTTGRSPERHGVDALDADVAQIGALGCSLRTSASLDAAKA
jgi:hypothetical protein